MFSVTKSFTGLIAEMLIAEGRLDDTERVSEYLPEVKGSAYEDATVRNVLDMEVGIDFSEIYDDPSSSIFQFTYAAGIQPCLPVSRHFLRCTSSCRRCARRNARPDFHYVTANSEVLGWVIERITGEGFAHTFEERVYTISCSRWN